MKYFLAFLKITLLLGFHSTAQPWIDKSFDYDSLMAVHYGSALDFTGDEVDLSMHVYIPKCGLDDTQSKFPLILWIHGGSFLAGSKDDASILDLCREFAQRGYVTASIQYRLGFIGDDQAWQCNYPNYSCVFASDRSEWIRAYYRAVQDAKTALRFLIERKETYLIDEHNVFTGGESAGAFTALGATLLDVDEERFPETYALPSLPPPANNTTSCTYNLGKTFGTDNINRPDLGGIHGHPEVTPPDYTIKAIANFYGGMISDLLKNAHPDIPKPAIYSFHQPCDIIVPIDSAKIYWGLSWCFTNGYQCYGIQNNDVTVYGSRTISDWNQQRNYGYKMKTAFTQTSFPYQFLFGDGSCADQINRPCHAYDNKEKRIQEVASFFAEHNHSVLPCLTNTNEVAKDFILYPNPVSDKIRWNHNSEEFEQLIITDLSGQIKLRCHINGQKELDISTLASGMYVVKIYKHFYGPYSHQIMIKI